MSADKEILKLMIEKAESKLAMTNIAFIKTEIFPKYYSKKIQTLFDERHTGDYDIHSDIDVVTANDSIEFAKEFIENAKSYLNKIYS